MQISASIKPGAGYYPIMRALEANYYGNKMSNIDQLLSIMESLRNPDSGCPWDIKQTNASIAAYTLEETHEALDAIERDDMDNLCEELGDMLFHVVFHARIAEERGAFAFKNVVDGIVDKMTHRHPHVFDQNHAGQMSEAALKTQWQALKQMEKSKAEDAVFGANSAAMSAINRAIVLQQEAAELGFDWPRLDLVFDKLEEEAGELKQAIDSGRQDHISDELGDLFFVCLNIARHTRVNAEMALRDTNQKFLRRFNYVQQQMRASGHPMSPQELERMEHFWQESKSIVD